MRALLYVSLTSPALLALVACERNDSVTAPHTTPPSVAAVKQSAPKAIKWASLAPSAQLSCGLTKLGVAYCWGLNNYGQLGTGSAAFNSLTPQLVAGGHHFSEIAVAHKHACGIEGGTMYCWGHNDLGQLGNPISTTLSRVPIPVHGNIRFAHLAVGFNHTCGIGTEVGSGYTDLGYCWGSNDVGQMGNSFFGGGQFQDSPQEIQNLAGVFNELTGFASLKLYWIEGFSRLWSLPTANR